MEPMRVVSTELTPEQTNGRRNRLAPGRASEESAYAHASSASNACSYKSASVLWHRI